MRRNLSARTCALPGCSERLVRSIHMSKNSWQRMKFCCPAHQLENAKIREREKTAMKKKQPEETIRKNLISEQARKIIDAFLYHYPVHDPSNELTPTDT